jgi:hypothetical protein
MPLLQAGAKYAAGWFTGLNYYKLAAEALIVLGLFGSGYTLGHHRCEMKHATQETKAAQRETAAVVKDVEIRVPETQKKDAASNELRHHVNDTGEKLHESLAKSSNTVGCNFTDEQLRFFQQLAEATAH